MKLDTLKLKIVSVILPFFAFTSQTIVNCKPIAIEMFACYTNH
jgi:hypothetical protein